MKVNISGDMYSGVAIENFSKTSTNLKDEPKSIILKSTSYCPYEIRMFSLFISLWTQPVLTSNSIVWVILFINFNKKTGNYLKSKLNFYGINYHVFLLYLITIIEGFKVIQLSAQ